MAGKTLSEMDVKKIVQSEIKECFQQLTSDVKEIKQALLGNDYNHDGIVTLVRSHEDYIEANKNSKVAERGLEVIGWYERLNKPEGTDGKSKLQILEDGIDGLKAVGTIKKWAIFFGITNVGTLIAFVTSLVEKIK